MQTPGEEATHHARTTLSLHAPQDLVVEAAAAEGGHALPQICPHSHGLPDLVVEAAAEGGGRAPLPSSPSRR
jgi:hypothetical protein